MKQLCKEDIGPCWDVWRINQVSCVRQQCTTISCIIFLFLVPICKIPVIAFAMVIVSLINCYMNGYTDVSTDMEWMIELDGLKLLKCLLRFSTGVCEITAWYLVWWWWDSYNGHLTICKCFVLWPSGCWLFKPFYIPFVAHGL